MSTRSSKRKRVDMPRLALALRSPGIDARTWVTAGRTVETQWDAALGWVVVAQPYGSDLEQVELTCRQASALSGVGAGEYLPMAREAEVLIGLPAGSTEDGMPLVLGGLTNEEDPPPSEVNGLPINGEIEASTPAAVSPFDTEIKVSPHGRREQYAKARVVQALAHVLKADQPSAGVQLGSELAAQSFVLGEAFVTQLITVVDALLALVQTGANGGGAVVLSGLPAFQTLWSTPGTGIKAQLQTPGVVLSVKVKGE